MIADICTESAWKVHVLLCEHSTVSLCTGGVVDSLEAERILKVSAKQTKERNATKHRLGHSTFR